MFKLNCNDGKVDLEKSVLGSCNKGSEVKIGLCLRNKRQVTYQSVLSELITADDGLSV